MVAGVSPPSDGDAAAQRSGRHPQSHQAIPAQPVRSAGVGLNENFSPANPNQLGLQPSAASMNSTPPPTSPGDGGNRSSPDGSTTQMDGGNRYTANLGLQQTQPGSSSLGNFPKISSNFDSSAGPPRQQTRLEVHPTKTQIDVPAQVSRTPQAKSDQEPSNDKMQAAQTFADIAARRTAKPPDLFTHGLSAITPVNDTDGVTVIMPQELYEQRLLLYKFAIIGRIFLPPGAAPRSNEDYKAELSKSFQTSGDWKLLHLGKGYFSLLFRLQEDQLRAARHKSWRLSTGSIHIREWQPNFDPYKESSSTAQIWVRLYHLPTEYWHPEFLVGIFRSVGNVIKLDGNTAHGLVGHFARALVEVDLSKPLLDSVRVGLPDNLFVVDFSYENTPMLCSFCHYIGHSADQCRKAKAAPAGGGELDKGKHLHDNAPARKKKKWVEVEGEQKQSKRTVHIGTVVEKIHAEQEKLETSNSYDALQNLDSGEDKVPETQLSAGDIMDLVTGGSAASLQHPLKEKLIAAARDCAMNRQLRDERDATSSAAQQGAAAATADSDSGEEMEAQPPSTPGATVVPTAPATAPNMDVDQKAADGIDPPAQGETTLLPPSHGMVGAEQNVFDDSLTGGEGNSVNPSPHNTLEATQETTNNMVVPPTVQAKSINRRTKNKRKVTAVLPKRQLRSSTKNKSTSDVTPEMIEAYARNQCYYVPGDSLGQPKNKQVAPNSPHPKQLEEKLRAAEALGRHTSAYILDTGQRGGLRSMDLIANQQWGDVPHSEAYTDSDINSD